MRAGIVVGAAMLMALAACAPVTKGPPHLAFACTGGAQTWVVPSGVTEATFLLLGAGGW